MSSDSIAATVHSLDRQNLRLSAETFAENHAVRAIQAGAISRNTWITEAVEEKLARERTSGQPLHVAGGRAHG